VTIVITIVLTVVISYLSTTVTGDQSGMPVVNGVYHAKKAQFSATNSTNSGIPRYRPFTIIFVKRILS